ncbi:Rieske (2Fe-2S) protein [Caballeronia terrestris]|uniref:Rieske (2Fe-2S) protein n=1 Tax=Caballeronia terrestris TaxID=1226301 RepID=UPI001F38E00D|nr:Rieske 2Fe-2S domain-containing protein [Caballeronia terrestris]
MAFINGWSVILFTIEGTRHAIDNSPSHIGASLANGQLDGHFVRCPAHGLRIDLATGDGPRPGCLRPTCLSVSVVDGRVMVTSRACLHRKFSS